MIKIICCESLSVDTKCISCFIIFNNTHLKELLPFLTGTWLFQRLILFDKLPIRYI
ncbi:Uncharacterised protein [Vibrio cholerae]|nr:Uncharacterised protein [Vibrio cholerae]